MWPLPAAIAATPDSAVPALVSNGVAIIAATAPAAGAAPQQRTVPST